MNSLPTLLRRACLLATLIPIAASAQSDSLLEATVRLSKTKVKRDGAVSLLVILRNTSKSDRVVLRGNPGFTEAGGLTVVATNGRGERLELPATRDDLTREDARRSDRRVVLGPEEGLGFSRPVRVNRWFPTPGRYQVTVDYASPTPTNENRAVVSGEIEGSRTTSAPVSIEVVE